MHMAMEPAVVTSCHCPPDVHHITLAAGASCTLIGRPWRWDAQKHIELIVKENLKKVAGTPLSRSRPKTLSASAAALPPLHHTDNPATVLSACNFGTSTCQGKLICTKGKATNSFQWLGNQLVPANLNPYTRSLSSSVIAMRRNT